MFRFTDACMRHCSKTSTIGILTGIGYLLIYNIDGLVQDCSISIAHVLKILQYYRYNPYQGADFVVAGGIAGCQNDSLRCRGWRQGGILATLCLPVPKLSPGNTLHVLSQNIWQYNTKFRWSMWSYSSIIIDDGGSSIWRLGCRWWHPGLSLWQLMLPPVVAGLTGWRLRFSVTV